MEKRYGIDSSDGILIIRFTDEPGPEDVRDAISDVMQLSPHALRLWDLTCGIHWPRDEIENFALYVSTLKLPPGKVAYLCPRDLAFGLAREFTAYRYVDGIHQEVFRSEQDAIKWLKSDSAD